MNKKSSSNRNNPDLTFVLLCSGNGADSSSYKPNRDDSQWWQRRDALVRCTSAALFSRMFETQSVNASKVKLILLFDGDGAEMHMEVVDNKQEAINSDNKGLMIPTEQNLIRLWKRASSRPNIETSMGSLFCTCRYGNDTETISSSKNDRMIYKGRINKSNCSKRDLLAEIRRSVTYNEEETVLSFLRKWNLNSPDEMVLRKTNRDKLLLALNDLETMLQTDCRQKSDMGETNNLSSITFTSIFEENIRADCRQTKKRKFSEAEGIPDTIAIFLHETSNEELPCFGTYENISTSYSSPKHVFIFLGAVRDMTKNEYFALSKACDDFKIPLCGCNLGRTAEFTSKIIIAIMSHHKCNKLGNAINLLYKRAKESNSLGIKGFVDENESRCEDKNIQKSNSNDDLIKRDKMQQLTAHFIYLFPMKSIDLSLDLSTRSMTWFLVRSCVCALWRSRLASSTNTSQELNCLQNEFSIIFNDGICLFFQQSDLVSSLAKKHQAAPTEHQILTAIIRKRDDALHKLMTCDSKGKIDWKKTLFPSLPHHEEEQIERKIFYLSRSFTEKDSIDCMGDFFSSFYARSCSCQNSDMYEHETNSSYYAFVIDASIHASMFGASIIEKSEELGKSRKKISKFAKKEGIKLKCLHHATEVTITSIDFVASFISMIQHFHYHGVLIKTMQNTSRLEKCI